MYMILERRAIQGAKLEKKKKKTQPYKEISYQLQLASS